LKKLSGKAVIIASSVNQDMRKERSGSSLSKSGSNPLINLSFLDNLPRIEDRKESKLSKIFPSKISIYPPCSQNDLKEWQKKN